MRHAPDRRAHRDAFDAFLWGEVLLFGLLGAALALFLSYDSLRTPYELPHLRLVLTTLTALAGGLVALLTATRFAVEGRRVDLLLCCGFFTASAAWVAFTIGPAVSEVSEHRTEAWAGVAGRIVAWAAIAAAPFVRGRIARRRAVLGNLLALLVLALAVLWGASRALGVGLPSLDPLAHDGAVPFLLTSSLAVEALLDLVAVVGFANRFRRHGDDLDRWLALGSTLMLFASLHFICTPLVGPRFVSQGDFLRLLASTVLLVGVWRAIRASEFGRVVAEERARVAREVHDGLAQYLFAISAHASMLEAGVPVEEALPRLKEATEAAQREARFAVLALSSASGTAPFDAALRRYVDFLTADGALDVELEIDPQIRLAPDEQIEVFRIVQEGLANVRTHAGARRAWVTIGTRFGRRHVTVRDEGSGFVAATDGAGQGLRNMRRRAASIGGSFNLDTAPGRGTALDVVLRG